MKKTALTVFIAAGLITPTVSMAQNLFPSLTYPTVWGPTVSEGKTFVEVPTILPSLDE